MSTSVLTKLHLISEAEIVEKACTINGFSVTRHRYGGWETSNVGGFTLDENLLKSLEEAGFTLEPGKDTIRENCIYLTGHSNQKGADVFESDCWMWHKEDEKRLLTISFHLFVSEQDRGIQVIPHVWGNCRGGACHQPTINRLVKTIARHFENIHPLLKKMAENLDYPIISWTDIGLGGLRSLHTLFDELYGKNKIVLDLASWHQSPFNPNPEYKISEGRYFVPEQMQVVLMNQWRVQLQEFKNSLR